MEQGVTEAVDPAIERGEPIPSAVRSAHERRHRGEGNAESDRRRLVVANDRYRGRVSPRGQRPIALASPKV